MDRHIIVGFIGLMAGKSPLGAKKAVPWSEKGQLAPADESNDYIRSQILYNLHLLIALAHFGTKRDHSPMFHLKASNHPKSGK